MEYTRFGRTDLNTSSLCLGTMPFGLQCDSATSMAVLDAAVGHGINFIDTADAYPQGADIDGRGTTEQIIGEWMAERSNRDDLVLATKFWAPMGHEPWQRGGNRRHIMSAVDASLKRLGTDHIDVYQIHFPDPDTPIEETLEALTEVVASGKVGHIGCSNFEAWQVARANGIAAANNLQRFDSVQPRYSAVFRSYERDLFPLCELDEIAVLPYNPLAGGLLTGKYTLDVDPAGDSRFGLPGTGERYRQRYWRAEEFAAVDELSQIAADAGIGLIEMAIAWVRAQNAVSSVIVGATKPEQLVASVAAVNVTLDDDVLTAIDAATESLRNQPFV